MGIFDIFLLEAVIQLVRPGAPCVMGGFTSNVDMRTGSPAFGTPEYVHAALATAQIGRRLRIGSPQHFSSLPKMPTFTPAALQTLIKLRATD